MMLPTARSRRRASVYKRNQVVTVGIAGVHSQYRGRILRRSDIGVGWWVVRELPSGDAQRDAYIRSLRGRCDMCVHDSQLAA